MVDEQRLVFAIQMHHIEGHEVGQRVTIPLHELHDLFSWHGHLLY